MAMKNYGRVKFSTSTTGQGDVTVGTALGTDFGRPADVGYVATETTGYIITEAGDVEVGLTTIGASALTFARTTVYLSIIAGVFGTAKMNLQGAAIVRFGPVAELSLIGPASSTDSNIAAFDGTGGNILKDGGVTIASLLSKGGGTLTGALNWSTAVTFTDDATPDIGAAASNYIILAGTTTTTAFDTIAAGAMRWVKFTGAMQLTHNGTSFILIGGANITTVAGDTSVWVSEGSGNWRMLSYTRAAALAATLGANTFTGAQTVPASGLLISGATSGALTLVAPAVASTYTATFPAETMSIGYLNVPQNSQSAAYTTVLTDSGKHILHPSADTTARIFTIDSNANVAYPVGTAITFVNQASAGVMTIAITTDTMRLAGAGTTGSRTLAANGIATAIKLTSTEWLISGTGLT